MGRKRKNKSNKNNGIDDGTLRRPLKEETLQAVLAIIFFVLATFFILAAFRRAGVAGNYTYNILTNLFGVGYFLLPILLITVGILFLKAIRKNFAIVQTAGSFIFFFSALAFLSLLFSGEGGIVGTFIANPLQKLFDLYVSLVIVLALMVISVLVIFDISINLVWKLIKGIWRPEAKTDGSNNETEIIVSQPENNLDQKETNNNAVEETADTGLKSIVAHSKASLETSKFITSARRLGSSRPFTPPPLSLLESDRGKPGVGDVKANANIIKRTLQNFGIIVEMDEISIGPSVTRYALKPAEGVKLSKIIGLQNNLELALAAHPVRIEAPIPGKSLVGIEIPNQTKTTVGLASLLSAPEYQGSDKSLLVSLGKGISGMSFFANLGKMPHLLIAGSTGSGKSVTIHALITSLLFRNPSENLRFIMIDPKRVELTLYNGIPHLLTPVITNAKKVILALKWAAKEMDRRYDILELEKVRDIESYHKNILESKLKKVTKDTPEEELPEAMPYIVIIIDELADIMQSYPRELEAAVVRLAQMSRAVGIHLILSTQRPSVNIITGLIKANIPSRIALQVSSQIDSRTILDMSGAEKLLGAGDMLFLSGEMSKPSRIQSAYISEAEVKKVVKFLKENYENELPDEIDFSNSTDKNTLFESSLADNTDDNDELYEDAREIVIKAGKASTSYLQRKLRVGYARAARLIDMLEERGVIGPGEGAKPREVLEKDSVPDYSDITESTDKRGYDN